MKGMKKRLALACSACLLTWSGLTLAQAQLNVLEVEGEIQRAVAPVELVKIEAQGELTMRALRAFGLLPDSFMGLAMELRRSNIDLLAATVDEVRALQPRIEDGSLKADKDAYTALLTLLESQAYLEWSHVEKGQVLSADEPLLVRGEGRIRGQVANQPHLPSVLLAATDLNVGVNEIVLAQQAAVPAPPEVSRQVTEKMGEWLAALSYASLSWRFDEQGSVIAELKGAVLEDAFEGTDLPLGDLMLVAEPVEPAGVWNITAQLPTTPALTDGTSADLDLKGENIRFGVLWSEADDRYQGAHLAATSLELTEGRERILLEGLDAVWRETTAADGRAEGQFTLNLAALGKGMQEGAFSHSMGEVSLSIKYDDYDLTTLEEVASWFELADMARIFDEADQQLQRLITALGNYDVELRLSDLSAISGYGRQTFNLGGLQIHTRSGVSPEDAERRDSYSRYSFEGLNFAERGDGITAERLQFSVGLQGFKPQLLTQLMSLGELSPDQLASLLSGAFSRIEVAAESGAVIATERAAPLFTIHGFQAGLNLDDFDKEHARIALNYEHSGFSGMDVPPELAPETAKLDLNLAQIPWPVLVAGLINQDIGSILFALLEQETQLNLETLSLGLPGSSFQLTGLGTLDELDPATGEPVFKAQLQLEARGLPAAADSMRKQIPERELGDFNQFMAIVMMAAEEVSPELHRFKIDISSRGELLVNGKDMTPMLQ